VPGHELVQFLLRHRVIAPADVVERELRIVDRGRDRFVVRSIAIDGRARAYVKQRIAAEAQPYLDAEIGALAYLAGTPALTRIGPGSLANDPELGLVAMTALPGEAAIALDEPTICEALAGLLATLHRETLATSADDLPPMGPSPALQVAGVLGDPPTWQPAALHTVWPLVAHPRRLKLAASQGREAWRPVALIHGDIKTEHCFAAPRVGGGVEVRVIDWELSGLGDPAWDVACALSEILTAVPVTAIRGAAPLPDAAARFLRTYANAVSAGGATASFLERVTLYAGLRFFQSSLERAMVDATDEAPIRMYLDWSDAILGAPGDFAQRLQAAAG
jgi:hypothetical protein